MFTILIVEDNKILNKNFEQIVDWASLDMGIVGNAFNGEQGLEMALELKPDLIIADVDMPKIDGLEMCKRIKNELPDTRFIFISAYDSFSYVQKAMDIGAYKYILKPVLSNELAVAAMELYEHKSEKLQTIKTIEDLHSKIRFISDDDVEDFDESNFSGVEISGYKDKIVAEIKSRISENYATCSNLNDVINELQISAGYANFIFKERTGVTIFDYLVQTKMEKAIEMLKDPFVRVYEVAEKIGYSNSSHFISVFKSYTGFTPKQYIGKIKTDDK